MMDKNGHRRVGSLEARARRIDEVLNNAVAANLEEVGKADQVALDIGKRVLDGITHPNLCGLVDQAMRFVSSKTFGDCFFSR